MNTPAAEKWTTADVCRHYRITPRTVKNLRDKGILPAIRISARLIRFDAEEVANAFRNQRK